MDKAREILEQMPNVKIGLDNFYGQQTVLNALNKALNTHNVASKAHKKMKKKIPLEVQVKVLEDLLEIDRKYIQQLENRLKQVKDNASLDSVMQWVAVDDDKPKDCESIIGIEMPCEARYACHREDSLYVSDETGESVVITHWMYAPEPPCA